MRREINYGESQILRMSEEQINSLGLLCPKKVYFQLELSWSVGAWTNCGEYLVGYNSKSIIEAVSEIQKQDKIIRKYNDSTNAWNTPKRWDMMANIRVIF